MAYSAIAVANAFIELAVKDGKNLTPMKLQKLVFIANGWMLGVEGKALVDNHFEVWRHGPVEPNLYHALKKYGGSAVKTKITSWDVTEDGDFRTTTPVIPEKDSVAKGLMKVVWQAYGDMDAFTLSEITHLPDSPWSTIKERKGFNALIPSNVIQNYYSNLSNQ
ncbi:hypothetical protein ABMA09_18565 [Erwinia rhapontici]|uniref:Panacea domain-containing protein n=1 Tax=Erwinia rhapontici TaxID=55212 RepID=UPI003D369032